LTVNLDVREREMSNVLLPGPKRMLLTCALVGMFTTPASTQTMQAPGKSAMPAAAASATAVTAAVPLKYNSVSNDRQATLLRRHWGVDEVHVRSTASGSLVRFSYRVLDADRAKLLNSKEATPYLIDEQHGLALQVPVMEQVGQLRQVAAPENGREYWMAFSNKGKYVKPGNHVTLMVGNLRISGLIVE
jgi:hypothetical protein